MRLSMNLNEDQELRDAVKELVKSQVISVIRETISERFEEIFQKRDEWFQKKVHDICDGSLW